MKSQRRKLISTRPSPTQTKFKTSTGKYECRLDWNNASRITFRHIWIYGLIKTMLLTSLITLSTTRRTVRIELQTCISTQRIVCRLPNAPEWMAARRSVCGRGKSADGERWNAWRHTSIIDDVNDLNDTAITRLTYPTKGAPLAGVQLWRPNQIQWRAFKLHASRRLNASIGEWPVSALGPSPRSMQWS